MAQLIKMREDVLEKRKKAQEEIIQVFLNNLIIFLIYIIRKNKIIFLNFQGNVRKIKDFSTHLQKEISRT